MQSSRTCPQVFFFVFLFGTSDGVIFHIIGFLKRLSIFIDQKAVLTLDRLISKTKLSSKSKAFSKSKTNLFPGDLQFSCSVGTKKKKRKSVLLQEVIGKATIPKLDLLDPLLGKYLL